MIKVDELSGLVKIHIGNIRTNKLLSACLSDPVILLLSQNIYFEAVLELLDSTQDRQIST